MAEGDAIERVSGLAGRLGPAAGARTVFGDPVERDGVTVVPVARARWGFGGGSGEEGSEQGGGAGGGVSTAPAGFIEISGGRATYHPIRDPLRLVLLGAAVVALIAIALRPLLR